MQTINTVAQCRWQTTFDDQSRAHQLQQQLSDFSCTVLPAIIDECLHQICPPTQVWRIETLVLDLGELAFDTLTAELPTKIASCLSAALERLKLAFIYQSQKQGQNPAADEITILGKANAPMDHIGCFLQSGIAPWWSHTSQSSLNIFEQQLLVSPQGVAAVIRRVGVAEQVRKRLVWQWGESGVKQVIVVLEPYHHDYILNFTEQLFRTQAKNNLPKCDSDVFERNSWFWVLTHLLVERGSMFNTRSFVGATVKKMARHFQIDYQQLLQQMIAVIHLQQRKGFAVPVFIQALIDLYQHNAVADDAGPLRSEKVNHWQRFNLSLDMAPPQVGLNTSSELAELFMMLSAQSPTKMIILLKKRGGETRVRQNLLRGFDQLALDRVVELLEPKEHEFILTHGKQSSELLAPAPSGRLLVWEVILAYLLNDSGSHFNRRQFVHHTLVQISKSSKIDYWVLLDMLTGPAIDTIGTTARFELLSIINQLKQLSGQETRQQHSPCQVYRQALSGYLAAGKTIKVMDNLSLPSPRVMFTTLLKQQPKILAQVVGDAVNTIQRSHLGSPVGAQVLAQRLLQMSVMADLNPLLRVIEPACMPFVAVFVEQLQRWQRQQYLPCLNGFDLYLQIYTVLLAILLDEQNHHFSVSGFLDSLTCVFTQAHGIDYQSWISQINQCVLQQPHNSCGKQIHGWITKALDQQQDKTALLAAQAPIKTARQWSWQDKSVLLLTYLRSDKIQRRQLLKRWQKMKLTLKLLVSQVISEQSQSRQWLDKLRLQHDRIELANALVQLELPEAQTWLNSLSPQRPDESRQWLDEWQNAIAEAGLWQGSGALLRQQLGTIYRLCVLELALEQIDLNPAHLNHKHQRFYDILLKASSLHLRLDGVNGLNQLQSALQPGGQAQSEIKNETMVLSGHQSLCHYLLCYGRLPLWFSGEKEPNLHQLINNLSQSQPQQLHSLIHRLGQNPAAMMRLHSAIDYPLLVELIKRSHPGYKSRLALLADLYQALLPLRIVGIDEEAVTDLLWQKTLDCWLTDDWSSLSPGFLLQVLSDELSCRYAVAEPKVAAAFAAAKTAIPEPFSQVTAIEARPVPPAKKMSQTMHTTPAQTSKQPTLPISIPVNNAGVVILQGFIKPLFAKQNLLNGEQFVDEQAQRDAVHFIQYLITGCGYTQEQHLVLNKLLCGLAIDEPIEAGVDMSAAQIATCEGLLKAAIKYWPAIGDCSLAALRGNWLVRSGVLHHSEEQWELTVEKRPYDVLLEQAPFSYSIINFTWMEKPLYVNYANG